MNKKSTLNILNGQEMYEYFKRSGFDKNGTFIPFNEAMCVGEATVDIFSSQFNKCRCNAHRVTIEQYNEITLKPLEVLFKNQFSHIVLWFDDDMFCQINLLTLLAYLDETNYKKNITFNLTNREFKVVDSFELDVHGYSKLYKKVMINKCMPENVNISLMENGIRLYLEYLKEENEITAYIRQRDNLESDILVSELLKAFPKYGLGDTQYIQLIERCKKNN